MTQVGGIVKSHPKRCNPKRLGVSTPGLLYLTFHSSRLLSDTWKWMDPRDWHVYRSRQWKSIAPFVPMTTGEATISWARGGKDPFWNSFRKSESPSWAWDFLDVTENMSKWFHSFAKIIMLGWMHSVLESQCLYLFFTNRFGYFLK